MKKTQPAPDPTFIFRNHEIDVNYCTFSPCNKYFASGDQDGTIIFWSMKTFRQIHKWTAHTQGILSLAIMCKKTCNYSMLSDNSEDDLFLISHGRDNSLIIWEIKVEPNFNLSKNFDLPVNALNFCKFSYLIDCNQDLLIAVPNTLDSSLIDIYNLSKKNILMRNIGIMNPKNLDSGKTGITMCVKLFIKDKNEEEIFLVAGYESGEIILFNLSLDESNFAVGKVKYFKEPVLCLDVSPDGHLLIAGGPEPKVVKLSLDFDKKKPPSTFFELELNNVKGISDLKFRKDQKLFGLAGWDKNIRIFKSENLQTLAMFTSHRDGINCLDFSNPIDKKTDIHPKSNSLVISKDRDADDIHFLESSVVKNYLIAASKDTKISLWQIY